mmetsp:Transcript_82483/g.137627  ORF Transcript_82483/g.137627 Transcript_82483/m.137627 type:complete len:80 (-) Transcript_82483:17-256(-)
MGRCITAETTVQGNIPNDSRDMDVTPVTSQGPRLSCSMPSRSSSHPALGHNQVPAACKRCTAPPQCAPGGVPEGEWVTM